MRGLGVKDLVGKPIAVIKHILQRSIQFSLLCRRLKAQKCCVEVDMVENVLEEIVGIVADLPPPILALEDDGSGWVMG